MTQRRFAGAGLGAALLSCATFSTSGSFAKSLIDAGWSPGAAVTVRISIAALILAGPAVVTLRGNWQVLRRNLRMLTVYGLLAVAGGQVFYFYAVQRLDVGIAVLLEYLGILLVVAWLWIRHGTRPRRLTAVGAAVALIGLVLVLQLVSGAHLDMVGVLWGLAAAVGLAAYFVLAARTDEAPPPVVVACGGMAIGAVALVLLGLAGVLPMHATFGSVSFVGHSVSWLVPVFGLSVVAAAIAYVAGIHGARLLGPKLASFVGLTEVVFAVLVAWLLLGQMPSSIQLIGGLLILAGVALVRVDEWRGPSRVREAAIHGSGVNKHLVG